MSNHPLPQQAEPADTPPVHEALPRVLGPLDAVALVVGSIIGSGIFLKAGQVAKGLNSFGLVITVWIVIGIVTLFGSLSLAELAAMMPHAGGPYVYLRAAYGRLVAFLWCWAEFWIIRTGSVGALACATAIYLDAIVPLGRTGQLAVAILSVAGLTLVNAAGVRWGARVQNATTLIKVSFLLSLIVVPLLWGKTDTANLEPIWPQTFTQALWPALGLAMIHVLWPYDGWVNVAPVAEEIREPQRNVPIALALGVGTVILLYVGAVTSYHLVLPMDQVIKSDAIAADVCGVLLGGWGKVIAAGAVMCSTFGALNSNLLCGPRIYLAAARDGLLPSALHHLSPTRRTPANAIVLQGTWGIVLILVAFAWKSRPIDAFDDLTAYVIFGATVFYALAVAAVFVLRRTQPQLERPYRVWGYPFTPALYLAAFVAALASLLYEKYQQTLVGSGLILAGAAFFFVASRKASKPKSHGRSGT